MIDWKSKGHTFDNKGICPFCTEPLDIEIYPIEKKILKKHITKYGKKSKRIRRLSVTFKALY